MSAKKHERRTPTLPRIIDAVTVETRPQFHTTGMEPRAAELLLQSQRVHLLSGNFPQALATAFERIAEHLGLDTGDPLDVPLTCLRLPESIIGPLEAEGVCTVADTLAASDAQLLSVVRFGKHGLRELRATVRAYLREKSTQFASGVAN